MVPVGDQYEEKSRVMGRGALGWVQGAPLDWWSGKPF